MRTAAIGEHKAPQKTTHFLSCGSNLRGKKTNALFCV